MIKSIIELAAGASVGMVIDGVAKHVRPSNLKTLGKIGYKVGTLIIGTVVTEACLDYAKEKVVNMMKKEGDVANGGN
jgi:hypothetical protein